MLENYSLKKQFMIETWQHYFPPFSTDLVDKIVFNKSWTKFSSDLKKKQYGKQSLDQLIIMLMQSWQLCFPPMFKNLGDKSIQKKSAFIQNFKEKRINLPFAMLKLKTALITCWQHCFPPFPSEPCLDKKSFHRRLLAISPRYYLQQTGGQSGKGTSQSVSLQKKRIIAFVCKRQHG